MNERRMRKWPPMICGAMVTALYLAAGIVSIGTTPVAAEGASTEEPIPAPAAVTTRVSTPIFPQTTPEPYYTATDTMLLQVAMAEAESESVEGKALVMLVVRNRVRDAAFPDTVEAVIFQRNQFQVTAPGGRYWTVTPDAGCYEELGLIKDGWDESGGALYFESIPGDCWHSRNLEYLFTVGGHDFYR